MIRAQSAPRTASPRTSVPGTMTLNGAFVRSRRILDERVQRVLLALLGVMAIVLALFTPMAVAVSMDDMGSDTVVSELLRTAAESGTSQHFSSSKTLPAEGDVHNVLMLSEVLARAQRHGPGFAQARLQTRSRELESALADARQGPVLTVTGRTDVLPESGQRLNADMEWDFHDDFTLGVHVGTTWTSGAAGSGSVAGGDAGNGAKGGGEGGGEGQPGVPWTEDPAATSSDRLTLSFNRKLWPRPDAALEKRIETVEARMAGLDEYNVVFDAHVAVLEAFDALDQALRAEAMAATQLELAVARTRIAEDGFAAGDRGPRELQDAQHAERQALVARGKAATARTQAALHLQRLLGDELVDELRDAIGLGFSHGLDLGFSAATWPGLPQLVLDDDLAWSPFIDGVRAVLAEAGDGVLERMLASDTAYLNARLVELRAVVAQNMAESAQGLQWDAQATYSLPLSGFGSGSGSGSGANSGPVSGSPFDDGQLTAFIGASWTWGRAGDITVEQASLALTDARMQTRTARQTALDGVVASLQAIEDAAFAKDVANMGLEQALVTLELVERQVELGFAGPLELTEAGLGVEGAQAEFAKAQSVWHSAWLDIARRLGLPFPGSSS